MNETADFKVMYEENQEGTCFDEAAACLVIIYAYIGIIIIDGSGVSGLAHIYRVYTAAITGHK